MGLFSGFAGGVASGAKEELGTQEDRAFKLKLQNAQIEGQIKKEQAMHDYTKASAKTTAEIFGDSGMTPEPGQRESVAELGLLAGNQRAEMSAKARARSGPSGMRAQVIGDGPDQKIVWFDKNQPEKIAGELKVGQNPAAYKQYAKTAGEYSPVKVTVDNLNSSIDGLLNDEGFLKRGINAAELKLGALVKEGDERVIDIINNRKGYALQIAAVVNKGRPSDPDARAIESMLPNEYDSLKFAKLKMDRIDKMLSSVEESDYKMLMAGELPQFRKDKNAKETSGFSADAFKMWKEKKLVQEQASKVKKAK